MDEKISRRDRKRQEQEQQRKKKGKLKPIIISIISVILLATGAFAYIQYIISTTLLIKVIKK